MYFLASIIEATGFGRDAAKVAFVPRERENCFAFLSIYNNGMP
jgi:hypothetical protein